MPFLIIPWFTIFVVADFNNPPLKANAIKTLYSPPNPIFSFHFDQSASPALFGIPASNDRNRGNFASYGKMLIQFGFVDFARQITDVQFSFHV
jgi:hypothetical protein